MVELTHYKLTRKETYSIHLNGTDNELFAIEGGGAVARDPNKEFLSEIVKQMNTLFEGELTNNDMLNYAHTLKDKLMENSKVVEQVSNNSKKQAMIGGFVDALNDAVIESLDAHKSLATQTLDQEKVCLGLANIVYELICHNIVPAEERA
ncbi:MAG: hypothetical protein KAG53_10495 [Endozoicomonadaceae bacterium]|nr:hypothetical protein [Endozoicomonadaceae bacterium]